jgi:hypothetical protein
MGAATVEDLAAVESMNTEAAQAVYDYFRKDFDNQ